MARFRRVWDCNLCGGYREFGMGFLCLASAFGLAVAYQGLRGWPYFWCALQSNRNHRFMGRRDDSCKGVAGLYYFSARRCYCRCRSAVSYCFWEIRFCGYWWFCGKWLWRTISRRLRNGFCLS